MTSHPFDSIYQDFFGEPPKKNEKDTANRVPAQATLDQQLEALNQALIEMGGLIEDAIENAVEALRRPGFCKTGFL